MVMDYLDRELRKTGDPKDEELADAIAKRRKEREQDVYMPVASKEAGVDGVIKFSPEAREALEKEGFVIYKLTGQSIDSERSLGREIHLPRELEGHVSPGSTSAQSEVAISPDRLNSLFVFPGAYSANEYNPNFKKYSQEISNKISGVRVRIGSVADYVDLAFVHFDKTGERLFGERYENKYAKTIEEWTGRHSTHYAAFVGFGNNGVNVVAAYEPQNIGYTAPLVFPK